MLVAALLALLLIAALVTGVLFAAVEATRVGVASTTRGVALTAAEAALERSIQSWSSQPTGAAGIGSTTASSLDDNGLSVSVYVTRLDSALYWLVADAQPARAGSGIGSRIGAIVRLKTAPGGSITVDRISERWWSELF